MTSFLPRITAPLSQPQPPPGPKLSYGLGETCFIHAGLTVDDTPILSRGKVVYWFDLPDLAQRFYIIRLDDNDWYAFEVRDALLMAPSPDVGLPFLQRRMPAQKTDRPPLAWNAT